MVLPLTNYAESHGADIAYRVVGRGRRDIVWMPPFATHLDMQWELPEWRELLDGLSKVGRVIVYDKRGTGLSDRGLKGVTADLRCDDLFAVMDATDCATAVLLGFIDTGAIALLAAAKRPERVNAVIAGETMAVSRADSDHPYGLNPAILALAKAAILSGAWGRALLAPVYPNLKMSQQQKREYAKWESRSATPRAVAKLIDENAALDIRPYLSSVTCPVLLLHDIHFPMVPVEGVRWLADRLPSATVKLIESSSRLGSGPPLEAVLDEVGDFIQGTRVASKIRTEVATLLVTDVVSSTATIVETGDHSWTHLLDSHRKLVRAALARFGGVEIDTAGDGFMTKFKSPSSAIRCALELIVDAETSGYRIRAAVHTSEITLQAKNVTGIGVHIAARVAAVGEPSKVLTTDAVRILLLGSDFKFIPRGSHSLKGVPGSWDLFAVTASTGTE